MIKQRVMIGNIPALIWGGESDRVWLCVHGKLSSKDAFEYLAEVAAEKGYQTISFDLPGHGERMSEGERCDIWNGVRDLKIIGDYVFESWKNVSLFGCSLGAFFSLHAYHERRFEKCLFQSPILDMKYLIRQMMNWFGISEERLEREREIETPIDIMTWEYYQYVLNNPIRRWDSPTGILFGEKDELQTVDIMNDFVRNFGGRVTVSPGSEHPFMSERDAAIAEGWLRFCMQENPVESKREKNNITFEQITKLFAFDTKQRLCTEIDFKLRGSEKFDHCWMGKMWNEEKKRDVYWYGLTGDGKNAYEYAGFNEMAEAKVFDGRSLREVWDDIELFSIDMSDPEEMIGYYTGENSGPIIMMGTPTNVPD